LKIFRYGYRTFPLATVLLLAPVSSAYAAGSAKAPTVKTLEAQVAQLQKQLAADNSEIAKLKASAKQHTSTPPTTAAPKTTADHVGSTEKVSMSTAGFSLAKADVTLVAVTDPAQGADQFTVPDDGKRFVGVEFKIDALEPVSDDENDDATLVGSDNQTYTTDFSDIAGCTNFNDGEVALAAGTTATGCVTFQVPTGVTVAKINFGSMYGTVGQWLVP
jgi:hypothetical protein